MNTSCVVSHSELIATAVEPSCRASHSIMRSYASSEELHRYRKTAAVRSSCRGITFAQAPCWAVCMDVSVRFTGVVSGEG